MINKVNITILLAIICNCAVRWQPDETIYFIGQAVTFLMIGIAGRWSSKSKYTIVTWDLFILMTINNLIDEVIFDPVNFGVNEILFGLIAITITIKRLVKCQAGKRN